MSRREGRMKAWRITWEWVVDHAQRAEERQLDVEAERFFAEVDATFGQGPPDVGALTGMAARHSLAILPPPEA